MGEQTLAAELGGRIAEARRAHGLTKTDLAERLHVGVGVIDRFERGVGDPLPHLGAIANAVGARVDELWQPGGAADPSSERLHGLAEWERRLRGAEAELATAKGDAERREAALKGAEVLLAAGAAEQERIAAALRAEAQRLEALSVAQRQTGAALERRDAELTAREEAAARELATIDARRGELAQARHGRRGIVERIRTLLTTD